MKNPLKKCLQKLNRPNKLFADMKKTVCRKLPQEKKIVCTNNSMETIILFVFKKFSSPPPQKKQWSTP